MNTRPRASLGRVLDDLGATLLDLAHGDPERAGDIGGVVIHDPLDQPVLPKHALVLGVGVEEPGDVARLLRELGSEHAAGLVLRAPVLLDDDIRAAADASGVAVLGLSRGAPWGHLAEMLRSLLAEGDVGAVEPESLGGLPSGDLFAVANAVASLLDAPITIEDRNSRVLAFSGRQDEADPSRIETILGRQVPERYSRSLNDRGVFRDLLRSDMPLFIDPDGHDGFSLPRVAIAVRAGDEVLGSIWAAVTRPLSEERNEALRESAKLVALHLLRVRAGADVQRRVRADLLSSALEGGVGAGEALERLGLASQPLLVLGRGSRRAGQAPGRLRQRRRDARSATAQRRLRAAPRCGAPQVGGRGDRRGHLRPPAPRRARWARPRRADCGSSRTSWTAWGTGCRRSPRWAPSPPTCSGLAPSRSCVDRVLRVLREAGRERRLGHLDELQGEALDHGAA